MLADVHERLAGVMIENLPWYELIEKYDNAETLFYLDPPYWDCETDSGKGIFSKSDFHRMAKTLSETNGRFFTIDQRRAADPRDLRRIRVSGSDLELRYGAGGWYACKGIDNIELNFT